MCDTLYHYCSNDSFLKIVQSEKLRLSSLRLSNDSLEGKWLLTIIEQMLDQSDLSAQDKKRAMYGFPHFIERTDGLGFCLSELRDQLSQWRGYADDANGVCIGFSKEAISELTENIFKKKDSHLTLMKIIYDPKKQKKHLKDRFEYFVKAIGEGANKMTGPRGLFDIRSEEDMKKDDATIKKASAHLALVAVTFFLELFSFKNPAFSEEKEWRLFSMVGEFMKVSVEYEAAQNSIKPVRYFSFATLKTSFVQEVILGPKNISSVAVVKQMMADLGYNDVKVSRSAASYR